MSVAQGGRQANWTLAGSKKRQLALNWTIAEAKNNTAIGADHLRDDLIKQTYQATTDVPPVSSTFPDEASMMHGGDRDRTPLRQVRFEFQLGEKVKYWSDVHEQWVDSVVRKINRDENGRAIDYDLAVAIPGQSPDELFAKEPLQSPEDAMTATPHFHAAASVMHGAQLQEKGEKGGDGTDGNPSLTDKGEFRLGERVKYWSDAHEQWVDSRVQRINRDQNGQVIDYDLAVAFSPDKSLPVDKLAQETKQTAKDIDGGRSSQSPVKRHIPTFECRVGDKVQYWSETFNQWVDAVVQKVSRDDAGQIIDYDLDVKKEAAPSKIRIPPQDAAPSKIRIPPHRVNAESAAESEAPPVAESAGMYMRGRQRPPEPEREMSVPASHNTVSTSAADLGESAGALFEVNQNVEYWSDTYSRWIPAIVNKVRRNQGSLTYDLDVKKDVPASKIRKPAKGQDRSPSRALKADGMMPQRPQTRVVAAVGGPGADHKAKLASVGPESQQSKTTTQESLYKQNSSITYSPSKSVNVKPGLVSKQNSSITNSPSKMIRSHTQASLPAATASNAEVSRAVSPMRAFQRSSSEAVLAPPTVVSTEFVGGGNNKQSISYERLKPANIISVGKGQRSYSSSIPSVMPQEWSTDESRIQGRGSSNYQPKIQQKASIEYQQPIQQTAPKSAFQLVSAHQRHLKLEDLQIGPGNFDPKQPHILSQLVAKLGLSSPAVEPLQGFIGGRNEGVWILTDRQGARNEQYVLKLVSCHRIHHTLPTDTENFLKLSKDHPGLSNDKEIAFPLMLFACQGGGPRRYDLIVMKSAPGERLCDLLNFMWQAKKMQNMMKILRCVGACLKRFHIHYGNTQHTDMQSANVFWDEATQAVTFIDLGGMGLAAARPDNEHFKYSFRMMAEKWGASVEGCHAFDAGYIEGR